MRRVVSAVFLCFALAHCAPSNGEEAGPFALAIHGGAGTIPRSISDSERQGYQDSLERALRLGVSVLERGGSSLDAVEQVVRTLEDDPRFNAGKGAVYTRDGGHELDASIMDGSSLSSGAVAGVTTVANPVSLARLVMDRTEHVLLAGAGAEAFARAQGLDAVKPSDLDTPRRRDALQRWLEQRAASDGGGTVGAVALDRRGNLAAATSTGGLTGKMSGRVGDSPLIGAGTFADNRTCAVSATGRGEEFIRHGVTRRIAMLMELKELSLEQAARQVIHEVLEPGDGGIVAVGRQGEIVMEFNTSGMYRGAADSSGRFEVAIWE